MFIVLMFVVKIIIIVVIGGIGWFATQLALKLLAKFIGAEDLLNKFDSIGKDKA